MKRVHAEISPIMRKLSAYMADAIDKPLPANVIECAKLHIVDTFAAMISGAHLIPGKKALAYIKAQGGKREAGVIGSRIVTSAPNAAFANGMLAHADETDDVHAASHTHPGSGIVPAAFAIGERDRLSGSSVLRAIVLGYDICTRILLSIGHAYFWETGHHGTSFGRIFGAVATASALLKLDARQIRHALSYAAQQAAGMNNMLRESQHVQKAFLSGMAAQDGTVAALVVAHGMTGVEDVFSGDGDFFAVFSPNADRSQLTRGLGRDYEILRADIKRWSAGGPIQGPLHVLHDLIRKHDLKANEVEKLMAWMPDVEFEGVNDRHTPDNCVQHLLALMLLDGTVTFKTTHDFARMKDAKILALRKRMEVVGDPALTDARRRWRCVMEITLKDGCVLKHQTMAAKGGYENPLTREEADEKALDLMASVVTKRRALILLDALWKLDRIKDVRSLRKLVGA